MYKNEETELLMVSAKSNPGSVAGALAAVFKENGFADLQAVGAGAVNQAVKALAIARGYLAPAGYDITFVPAFTDINLEGELKTAMKFIVQQR